MSVEERTKLLIDSYVTCTGLGDARRMTLTVEEYLAFREQAQKEASFSVTTEYSPAAGKASVAPSIIQPRMPVKPTDEPLRPRRSMDKAESETAREEEFFSRNEPREIQLSAETFMDQDDDDDDMNRENSGLARLLMSVPG